MLWAGSVQSAECPELGGVQFAERPDLGGVQFAECPVLAVYSLQNALKCGCRVRRMP